MSYYGPDRNDHQSARGWIWWVFGLLIFILVLSIPLTYMGFFSSWATAPTQVFSVDNVRSLSRQANDMRTQLDAQLVNIRLIDDQINSYSELYGDDQSKWPQGKDEEYRQLLTQRNNRIAAWNSECGKYKSLWEDEWRSLPAPKDLDTYCEYVN